MKMAIAPINSFNDEVFFSKFQSHMDVPLKCTQINFLKSLAPIKICVLKAIVSASKMQKEIYWKTNVFDGRIGHTKYNATK